MGGFIVGLFNGDRGHLSTADRQYMRRCATAKPPRFALENVWKLGCGNSEVLPKPGPAIQDLQGQVSAATTIVTAAYSPAEVGRARNKEYFPFFPTLSGLST